MERIQQLEQRALSIRKRIVRLTGTCGVGHTGGSMSLADILAALYFDVMEVSPETAADEGRDRFILSKGHCTPGYYSALVERGYSDEAELIDEYDRIDGRFQGHPDKNKVPGVDMSTGSLGQGLSVGIGMALGARMKGLDLRVYVVMGDGEMQEGQIWEGLLFAGSRQLPGVVAIVDNNQLQLSERTADVLSANDLHRRVAGLGWKTLVCDGHDMKDLVATLETAKDLAASGPVFVQANTVKGKGVSFMENQVGWHSKAPNKEEMLLALAELEGTHVS